MTMLHTPKKIKEHTQKKIKERKVSVRSSSYLKYRNADGDQFHRPDKEPDILNLTPIEDISSLAFIRAIFDKNFSKTLSIGTLTVDVIEAANLPAVDFGGFSDPYCVLELSGFFGEKASKQYEWEHTLRSTARTHFEPRNLNPVWNTYGLSFPLRRHGAVLKVIVKDHQEVLTDEVLGHVTISINETTQGTYEGWFMLSDSADIGTQPVGVHGTNIATHGAAIFLRLRLELNPFGEACSFLWSPPSVLKPLCRFDPNIFFANMFEFKSRVMNKISWAVKAITDAIFWKRGPSYTYSVLAVALTLANHIDKFWIIFHLSLALVVLGTGYLTSFGRTPLEWPTLWASSIEEKYERDESLDMADQHHHLAPPVKRFSTSVAQQKGSFDIKHQQTHQSTVHQEAEVHSKKVFTGLTEITLRKAGRTLGKGRPMALAQATLVDMMKNQALFEAMLLWRRDDMKVGFKDIDGPVMASAFVLGNLALVLAHLSVELRYVAIAGVLVLFSLALVRPLGLLLPQAYKHYRRRRVLEKHTSLEMKRPKAVRRRKIPKDLANMVKKIFDRVDLNKDGSIDIFELMQALPMLSEDHLEHLREVFVAIDEDDSGTLDENEFFKLVCWRGGFLAGPLIVAELKHGLLGQGVPLIRITGSAVSGVTSTSLYSYFRKGRYSSVLRVTCKTPNGHGALSYQKRRSLAYFSIPSNHVTSIQSHPVEPQLLVVNLTDSALQYKRPKSSLVFHVDVETVRDALIAALSELLDIQR